MLHTADILNMMAKQRLRRLFSPLPKPFNGSAHPLSVIPEWPESYDGIIKYHTLSSHHHHTLYFPQHTHIQNTQTHRKIKQLIRHGLRNTCMWSIGLSDCWAEGNESEELGFEKHLWTASTLYTIWGGSPMQWTMFNTLGWRVIRQDKWYCSFMWIINEWLNVVNVTE